MNYHLIILVLMLAVAANGATEQSKAALDLSYPVSGRKLDADEIIHHVWYVNHFRAVRNYSVIRDKEEITWLAYRSSRGKFRFRTLERYLKNIEDPEDEEFTRDIVVFRYPGSIDGTGLLINRPSIRSI